MEQAYEVLLNTTVTLPWLAAVACGLLIGIERGWKQRGEKDGTRVAGVRTFTLIGGLGGLIGIVARLVSPIVAAVLAAAIAGGLLAAYLKGPFNAEQRDATTMVAALTTLLLGLVAGYGLPAFAVAGAAITTLVLATREQSHRFLRRLSAEEVRSIARFAVISAAVLPFLPDRTFGPYDAWNPFQLWLVVVLITGFAVAGYVANRLVGEKGGTLATALIGGAYSSTAVTAALATRLRANDPGPLATGIALATAVMYVRVVVLVALLAPSVTMPLLDLLAPAGLVGWGACLVAWRLEATRAGAASATPGKPFHLLPALGFLVAVAAAALLVRWAQAEYGEAGGVLSLFLAGSFDVDAAIVTLSGLPPEAIAHDLAALALAGTVAVNMAFKIAVTLVNARWSAGRNAALALLASLAVLLLTLAWRGAELAGWLSV